MTGKQNEGHPKATHRRGRSLADTDEDGGFSFQGGWSIGIEHLGAVDDRVLSTTGVFRWLIWSPDSLSVLQSFLLAPNDRMHLKSLSHSECILPASLS